jgi:hypothetical protein
VRDAAQFTRNGAASHDVSFNYARFLRVLVELMALPFVLLFIGFLLIKDRIKGIPHVSFQLRESIMITKLLKRHALAWRLITWITALLAIFLYRHHGCGSSFYSCYLSER